MKPDNKGVWRGHLSILAANIIFGTNLPVSRLYMPESVPALAVVFFRTFGALLFFWTLSLFVKWEKVPWRDLWRLALAAMFGIMLNQMLFVLGLQFASPLETAIVVTFTPILTMLLSAAILREPITWLKVLGVLIGLGGAILMIGGKYWFEGGVMTEAGKNRILGIALCAISGLSYAVYLTAFKNVISKYKPVTVMRWMFLASALVSWPLLYKSALSIDYAQLPLRHYLYLAFTVFGATGVAYLFIPIAQKNLRPTVLSVYNYLQPSIAACLAIAWGQEGFTWTKLIATVLVCAGVFCVTRSKSRAQLEAERKNQDAYENR